MDKRPVMLVHFSDVHSEETDLLHGVQAYVDEHDLEWEVNPAVGLKREWRLQRLDHLGPNTFILGRSTQSGIFSELRERGCRWVEWSVDGSPSNADASVSFDSAATGRVAAEHLHSAGARSFAFQGPDNSGMPQRRVRHQAFRDAVEAMGHTCKVIWPRRAEQDKQNADLLEFFELHPEPVGFFFYHDLMADRFLHILLNLGISVPSQAMLIGGSASDTSAVMHMPISSVRLPFKALGRALAKQAHLLLSGTQPDPLVIAPATVIARATTTTPLIKEDATIKRIQAWLRNDRRPIPTVAELAKRCSMHRNALLGRLQKAFKQTPKQWLMEQAMQRASNLLAESDRSIEEVARLCGFSHRNNFSQRFQKRFGIAPAAYRKQFH